MTSPSGAGSFPQAEAVAGSRVFDYVVQAFAGGRVGTPCGSSWTPNRHSPPVPARDSGKSYPTASTVARRTTVFSVTPRNCYGACGRALLTDGLIPA